MFIHGPGSLRDDVERFMRDGGNGPTLEMIEEVANFGHSIGIEWVRGDVILLATLFLPNNRQALGIFGQPVMFLRSKEF